MNGVIRIVVAVALVACASPSWAAALYGLNSGGDGNQILTVNPATGAGTTLWAFSDAEFRSYSGLAARPGNDGFLHYASWTEENIAGVMHGTPRLEKVEIATGARTTFPDISAADIGLPASYTVRLIQAVAISPNDPDTVVASISAFSGDFNLTLPLRSFLIFLDADTGLLVSAEVETAASLDSLAFSLDGLTLYGGKGGKLVTVDPTTGAISEITHVALPTILSGSAFDPDDGTLFSIKALADDELATLSETTGTVTSILGPIGVAGPIGLAFVPFGGSVAVPGMSVWALIALAACLLAVASSPRARLRQVG